MNVEASSSLSIETSDGDYSTMGFGGTFQEMEAEVQERLNVGGTTAG